MIGVLFQGGTHGNYLEFVLNRFLANVPVANKLPFNHKGAAHSKLYLGAQQFQAYESREKAQHQPVVIVQVKPDDLLQLICISLLRTGDFGTDPERLDIDTYNLMDNLDYRPVRDFIQRVFFIEPLIEGYNRVRQSNWPDISNFDDYDQLPADIRHSCEQTHRLELTRFDAANPNCPRYVLREFYKLSFQNPSPGQLTDQQLLDQVNSPKRHWFPYQAFYSLDQFQQAVRDVASWANMPFEPSNDFIDLHLEFLKRQPYKDSKRICDNIVDGIVRGDNFELPKLNVVQEGYVDAQLELRTGQPVPLNKSQWFVRSVDAASALKIV